MSYTFTENTISGQLHTKNTLQPSMSERIKANNKHHQQNSFNDYLDEKPSKPIEKYKTNAAKAKEQTESPKDTQHKDTKNTVKSNQEKPDSKVINNNQVMHDSHEANDLQMLMAALETTIEGESLETTEALQESAEDAPLVAMPLNPVIDTSLKASKLSLNTMNAQEETSHIELDTEHLKNEEFDILGSNSVLLEDQLLAENQANLTTNTAQTMPTEAISKLSNDTATIQIDLPNIEDQTFSLSPQTQIASTTTLNIQKAAAPEMIAQMPLNNEVTLNITKDANNAHKISINLEPAGMGEVELVIENNKDNAVMAVIRSDKPEILEQLRKETASLEQYLSEAGLDLGSAGLGFEQKSQDDTQQNQDNDTLLSANLAEIAAENTHRSQLQTNTERLYAALDRQSPESGLDIRL